MRWTMFNVTPREGQADCHLIQTPEGVNILIDPADAADAPGTAVRTLKKLKIDHLDFVVISHFHRDHYGRLFDILQAGIKVDKVYLNVPAPQVANRELPWGCDWNDVQSVLAELKSRNVPFVTPKAESRIYQSPDSAPVSTHVDVICAYDGIHSPIGELDVNDTSIVLRVTFGTNRILFTGDLNQKLGAYLAQSKVDLKADLLKAPHHGTEGMAPNEFFDRVAPKAVLVPSPRKLWESPRSMRLRNYCIERKIPVYVAGINGNVTVTLTATGYTIESER